MSRSRAAKRIHQKRQLAYRRGLKTPQTHKPRFSRRRLVLTIAVGVLLIATLVMIFLMSAENKAESGDRSGRVTGIFVDILFGRHLTEAERAEKIGILGHYVRKLAHMTEFAVLTAEAVALMILLRPVRTKRKKWPEWVIPFAVCVVYAASDEIHQIFSGRGPRFTDVLIDCAGGLIGLCLVHAAAALLKRGRKRRASGSKEKRHANQPI
ncbi:MAG: VanZ family protein [Clostridia bacterium]|nr:VanZ family protein [Clostridia bacterium]